MIFVLFLNKRIDAHSERKDVIGREKDTISLLISNSIAMTNTVSTPAEKTTLHRYFL